MRSNKIKKIFINLSINLFYFFYQKVDYALNWLNEKGRKLEKGEKVKRPKTVTVMKLHEFIIYFENHISYSNKI